MREHTAENRVSKEAGKIENNGRGKIKTRLILSVSLTIENRPSEVSVSHIWPILSILSSIDIGNPA